MAPRVSRVQYVAEYRLLLEFTDGAAGEIDFRPRIVGRGGVFKPLEDLDLFREVRVDPEAGTLIWPNDVDLCPDVLYESVVSRAPHRAPVH